MRNALTLFLLFFSTSLILNGQCLNTPEFPFTTDEDDYSWSGNLYPQSEVGGAVSINSVSFYLDNPVFFNGTYSTFEVYIRHTNDTQYPSFGKSWSAMGLVAGDRYYSGPLALTSGQGLYTLPLSSSFLYNGTQNLEVVFACIGGDAANYTFPQEPWFRRTAGYTNYPGNVAWDNFYPFSFEFKSRRQFKLLLVINGNQEIGIASNPCGIILPAAPIDFTATYNDQHRSTELTWTTVAETSTDYFEIQRSYDGQDFEGIGEVSGEDQATLEQGYSFEDYLINCDPGTPIYYRLKAAHFDGTIDFSETKAISCEGSEEGIVAYFDGSTLNVATETPASGQLLLINMVGQIVRANEFRDRNVVQLDMGNMPKGMYFVTLKCEDGTQRTIRVSWG